MKIGSFNFLFCVLFLLNSIAMADQNQSYFYRLKVGETASFILHRARLLPLYKKTVGSIEETASVNQQNIPDIDKLGLGEKIFFTQAQVDEALKKNLIIVSPEKEISFTELAFEIQKQKLSKKNLASSEKTVLEKIDEPSTEPIKQQFFELVQELRQNLDTLKQEFKELVQEVKENLQEHVKRQATENSDKKLRNVAAETLPQHPVEPQKVEAVVAQEEPKNKIILQELDPTFSELALTFGGGYSALNGYDNTNKTRAQLLSKINLQFQLNWIQNWSETTKTAFYMGYKSSRFEPDYRATQIYNSKIDTYKFGFQYEDELFQHLKYVLGFQQSEELFYRGILAGGAAGLEINAVPLSSFQFGLKKSLLKRGRYEMGSALDYNYIIGSDYQNYTIQNGNAYAVQLFLQEALYNKIMNCGFTYRERIQDTSILTFSEKNVDLSCFYKWTY